jgi:phytanoyl-CoA hydroxylase
VENGCIWVLSESHKQGFVEHVKMDIVWQCCFENDSGTSVLLKSGGLVAFHLLLFHRSRTMSKGLVLKYFMAGMISDARIRQCGPRL